MTSRNPGRRQNKREKKHEAFHHLIPPSKATANHASLVRRDPSRNRNYPAAHHVAVDQGKLHNPVAGNRWSNQENIPQTMSISPKRAYLKFLRYQNQALGMLACRAMRWRRFSDAPIHPKHLFDEQRASFFRDQLRPGISILDLGSGVGTECIAAAQSGAHRVVGIECDEKNHQQAVRRAKEAGVEVEFILHDLQEIPLPLADKAFDLVNLSNVLEHLNNRVAVLLELKRVKKATGMAVISVPNVGTSWKKALRSVGLDSRDDPDHKIEYTEASLKAELGEAGLEIISPLHPIVPSFPWHGLFALSAGVSPNLYRRLQAYKRRLVEKHPEESIGWTFLAR
jgi:2-polyprenyl-3-methyl-5-hydroxy-6-metoxy-1,4-benzoquinol methylase